MKKLLLSLALIFPLVRCIDDCGKDSKPYFDLQGIRAEAVRIININNAQAGYARTIGNGEKVKPDSLLLVVAGEVRYYSLNTSSHFGDSWAAYACDVDPPGSRGTKEQIKAITVQSGQNFDATHRAGSSLNEYFEFTPMRGYNYEPTANPINLTEYTQQFPVQAHQGFSLRLTQAPANLNQAYTFTITYELTNGEVYTAQTGETWFK